MSESPWNVKARNRRAPRTLNAEGAQVKHVPQHPPATAQPRARLKGKSLPEKQPQTQLSTQQEKTRAPQQKPKRPISTMFLVVVSALVLVTALAVILLALNQQKLDGLKAQRAAEAQRVLAHKQEHWNARANSGYQSLIDKYAEQYNLNPSFISAIIKCESSYRADAVSYVNARGLMQIMPDTGTWLAGRLNVTGYQPDSLFDPERNIAFGASYLAYLSDMFNGSPVMVAAAYHAGANNVKHWALERASDQKTVTLDMIPMKDTRDYVGKVMDAYAIYYEKDQGFAPVSLDSVLDDAARLSGAN